MWVQELKTLNQRPSAGIPVIHAHLTVLSFVWSFGCPLIAISCMTMMCRECTKDARVTIANAWFVHVNREVFETAEVQSA
jgi:hypothetical protein